MTRTKRWAVDVQAHITRYWGEFKKRDRRGRWRKFGHIGNAGIAEDFANLLKKLNHRVKIYYSDLDDVH